MIDCAARGCSSSYCCFYFLLKVCGSCSCSRCCCSSHRSSGATGRRSGVCGLVLVAGIGVVFVVMVLFWCPLSSEFRVDNDSFHY